MASLKSPTFLSQYLMLSLSFWLRAFGAELCRYEIKYALTYVSMRRAYFFLSPCSASKIARQNKSGALDPRKLRFLFFVASARSPAPLVKRRIKLRLIARLEKNPIKNRKKEKRSEFVGFGAEILSAVQGAKKRRRWSVFKHTRHCCLFFKRHRNAPKALPKIRREDFAFRQGAREKRARK